jgi:hypothetical protein
MRLVAAKPIGEFLPLAFSLQKKVSKADGILARASAHGNNKAALGLNFCLINCCHLFAAQQCSNRFFTILAFQLVSCASGLNWNALYYSSWRYCPTIDILNRVWYYVFVSSTDCALL